MRSPNAHAQAGSFDMKPGDKGPAGPPPVVKSILKKFGSKKEEDKMLGYLSFLKIGPKLLRFVPGNRAQDLRKWLTVYSYWNEGGFDNVLNMFLYIYKVSEHDFLVVISGALPCFKRGKRKQGSRNCYY